MNYQKTINACFIGYIVQAIVNNFAPLLFLTFQRQYEIPLSWITLLVTINFLIQLLVDLLSVKFLDRIGYRTALIAAHIFASAGLLSLTILPDIIPGHFLGLLLSVCIYALGGGLLEVLLSPVVEACPTDNKEKAMSLLHSFYCWGHMAVVLISTLFFTAFGIENWKFAAWFWAMIPTVNGLLFANAPIAPLIEEGHEAMSFRQLASSGLFWLFFLMMFCSGASEQAVSQWASTFAEQGLGISKTMGDLAGPMSFALFMGTARTLYGKYGERIHLTHCMIGSGILCVISYLCISLIPNPVIGLMGCALCGFSVGIMWPGTFSIASKAMPTGGTALFAMLALGGDLGCSGGPTLAGFISSLSGDNLRLGILSAVFFPILLTAGVIAIQKKRPAS